MADEPIRVRLTPEIMLRGTTLQQGPPGPPGESIVGPPGPKGDPGVTSWEGLEDKPDLSQYALLSTVQQSLDLESDARSEADSDLAVRMTAAEQDLTAISGRVDALEASSGGGGGAADDTTALLYSMVF